MQTSSLVAYALHIWVCICNFFFLSCSITGHFPLPPCLGDKTINMILSLFHTVAHFLPCSSSGLEESAGNWGFHTANKRKRISCLLSWANNWLLYRCPQNVRKGACNTVLVFFVYTCEVWGCGYRQKKENRWEEAQLMKILGRGYVGPFSFSLPLSLSLSAERDCTISLPDSSYHSGLLQKLLESISTERFKICN